MKPAIRNWTFYWLPPLAWAAMIFIFSSDLFSAEHTGSVLQVVLTRVFGPLEPASFAGVHFLLRKAGHLSEYALLAALLLRAWRAGSATRELMAHWVRRSLGLALMWAGLDEFHQGWVHSRGSSAADVALDMCGAALALVVLSMKREDAETVNPPIKTG